MGRVCGLHEGVNTIMRAHTHTHTHTHTQLSCSSLTYFLLTSLDRKIIACVCMCVCICVWMCVCVSVQMYKALNTHTHTSKHAQICKGAKLNSIPFTLSYESIVHTTNIWLGSIWGHACSASKAAKCCPTTQRTFAVCNPVVKSDTSDT